MSDIIRIKILFFESPENSLIRSVLALKQLNTDMNMLRSIRSVICRSRIQMCGSAKGARRTWSCSSLFRKAKKRKICPLGRFSFSIFSEVFFHMNFRSNLHPVEVLIQTAMTLCIKEPASL